METDYLLETNMVAARIMGEEKADIDQIIKDLIDTSWGGDNESQAKAVELLKGLAFSDDPKSNKFMQALDKFTDGLDAETFTESVRGLNENLEKVAEKVEKHAANIDKEADKIIGLVQKFPENTSGSKKRKKRMFSDIADIRKKASSLESDAYALSESSQASENLSSIDESDEEDYFVEAAMPKAEKDAMDISFEQLGVNVSAQFNKMYSDEFKKVLKDTMISGIKIMGDRKQLRTTMRQRAMKGLIKIKKQLNKTLKEI